MREKILAVIEKNSRIDIKDLAVLLGESEIAVANEIAEMEKILFWGWIMEPELRWKKGQHWLLRRIVPED